MEDVFDFLARVGVSDPGKVLTAARLGPYATANDFAALTDLSLKSVPCGRVADDLRTARGEALRESGFLLEFSGTRGCSFGQYTHSEVGGAPGRPGQTYAGSLRLSRLATSPCPGLTPLEHIAMGHEVSAFDVANSFQWVFLESSSVRDRTRYGEGPRPYSFHDRCCASGCSFLLPRLSLDEESTDRCARPNAPPAKRIRTSGDALSGKGTVSTTDSDARRLPGHLAMEASLRTQLHSDESYAPPPFPPRRRRPDHWPGHWLPPCYPRNTPHKRFHIVTHTFHNLDKYNWQFCPMPVSPYSRQSVSCCCG